MQDQLSYSVHGIIRDVAPRTFSWEARIREMQMDFRTVSETVSERIVRCQPQLVVLVVMDVEKASC
jgi:hypothetical protein